MVIILCNYVVVVVVTQPLTRDGGMTEYHGAPEAGQVLRTWIRDRGETESRKERVAQRVRSWTARNKTKSQVSWDGCPQALRKGFSILPTLVR